MLAGNDFLISGSTFDTDIELRRMYSCYYVYITLQVVNKPLLLKNCTAQRVCKAQSVWYIIINSNVCALNIPYINPTSIICMGALAFGHCCHNTNIT